MNHRSPLPAASPPTNAVDLEHAWDQLSLDVTSAAYRSKQPTPHDEDPLRHYATDSECLGKRRDKLPTLREFDPLRYDLEA